MIDWQKAYRALAEAGFVDAQISDISGVSRSTVCHVRNGTWPYKHDPGHEGGEAVLAAIRRAVDAGWLEKNPLEN